MIFLISSNREAVRKHSARLLANGSETLNYSVGVIKGEQWSMYCVTRCVYVSVVLGVFV